LFHIAFSRIPPYCIQLAVEDLNSWNNSVFAHIVRRQSPELTVIHHATSGSLMISACKGIDPPQQRLISSLHPSTKLPFSKGSSTRCRCC